MFYYVSFIHIKKCIRPILRLLLFLQRKVFGFQVEVIHRTKLKNNNPAIFAVWQTFWDKYGTAFAAL